MHTILQTTRQALLRLALAGAAACATSSGTPSDAPASPEAEGDAGRLDVSNRSSADMDVFLVRSGQRVRLGLAPASETTRFTLSRALMAGGSPYFEAVPRSSTAGVRQSIRTEPVVVRAGQVVTLDVPPQ